VLRSGAVPHDEAVMKVLYRRQVENSLSSMYISDVRHPFLVGPIGVELSIKQVAVTVDDIGELSVRTPPACYGLDTELAHDSKDLFGVDTKPVLNLKLTSDLPVAGAPLGRAVYYRYQL